MLQEYFIRKCKDGMWECYDRAGNKVKAVTKQIAINQYRMIYSTNNLNEYRFNLDNINKKLEN